MSHNNQRQTILQRLNQSSPTLCTWMMMPGGFQAGSFAKAGLDAVLIDMQHGTIGYRDMVEMVQAVNGAEKFAFVRPPLDDFAMVSRALDAGATGIICPMINSAKDAQKLVDAAKFPPVGARSWGAYLGQDALGLSKQEYLEQANSIGAVFAMVETRAALENLDEICAVKGLDGVFVGPNDLCISLTNGAVADVNHEAVQKVLPQIVERAKKAGKFAGIYTGNSNDIRKYGEMGYCFMPALTDTAVASAAVDRVKKELD